jgi:hypothetical protein
MAASELCAAVTYLVLIINTHSVPATCVIYLFMGIYLFFL